jgi:hypothetical protein
VAMDSKASATVYRYKDKTLPSPYSITSMQEMRVRFQHYKGDDGMISWITEQLAIADYNDVMTTAHDTDTVLIDARAFFDQKGIPLYPTINGIVTLINTNIFFNRKVIVFCDAGIDRAPYIVAKVMQLDWDTPGLYFEYEEIKKIRPCVIEHKEWEE